MAESFADKIIKKIEQAKELYYRLIILAAPKGAGKTDALRTVHERTLIPLINVNLELSQRMLDLTERQRVLQLPRLLSDIVIESASDAVLLDNIEILFDVSLKQDPLRLLQGISRNITVIAALSAEVKTEGGGLRTGEKGLSDDDSALSTKPLAQHLVYATTNHAEYRLYPVQDFLIVSK